MRSTSLPALSAFPPKLEITFRLEHASRYRKVAREPVAGGHETTFREAKATEPKCAEELPYVRRERPGYSRSGPS